MTSYSINHKLSHLVVGNHLLDMRRLTPKKSTHM